MEVSFGAKCIYTSSVIKTPNVRPTKVDAAIVELDHKNLGDWYALESFVEDNKRVTYADNIKDSFNQVMDGAIVNKNLHH